MVKGDYDFAILVTCLLILALQIHNPFQSQRSCQCGDSQQNKSPSPAHRQSKDMVNPSRSSAGATTGETGSRGAPVPAPPVYRRPKEAAAPAAKPGGLSTDELLRELNAIQDKAKEQQETLAAAGRMPPPSPILEQLREVEAAHPPSSNSRIAGGPAVGGMTQTAYEPVSSQSAGQAQAPFGSAAVMSSMGSGSLTPMPPTDNMLRQRSNFGRFLESVQPRGLGVILGVGRGEFAIRLLMDWASSQGLYLVDPFIHIWRGYDDPDNLSDRDHQVRFEELRNRLAPFEGRHVLVRDFSYSFAEVYQRGGNTPGSPTFVYVDNNHAEPAISRDLELWWPLLASGGILAGSTYTDDVEGRIRVKTAVDRFTARIGAKVYLTHDDNPPSWFIMKS